MAQLNGMSITLSDDELQKIGEAASTVNVNVQMYESNLPPFLTAEQCADLLQVSKRTFYEHIHKDPAFPEPLPTLSGRNLRFRRDDVLQFRGD